MDAEELPDDPRIGEVYSPPMATAPCVACGGERLVQPPAAPPEPRRHRWSRRRTETVEEEPPRVWSWLRRPDARRLPGHCPHCGAQ
ncbi:hypothetical protein GCM10010530_13820 [Kribbella aluminosa]